MGLTFVIAGGKHSLICRTGADVPYLPSLVQKDVLINDVILIIKVNDVDLKEKQRCAEDEAEKHPVQLPPLTPTAVQSASDSSEWRRRKFLFYFNVTVKVISRQTSLWFSFFFFYPVNFTRLKIFISIWPSKQRLRHCERSCWIHAGDVGEGKPTDEGSAALALFTQRYMRWHVSSLSSFSVDTVDVSGGLWRHLQHLNCKLSHLPQETSQSFSELCLQKLHLTDSLYLNRRRANFIRHEMKTLKSS